jgi:hypothetical protein
MKALYRTQIRQLELEGEGKDTKSCFLNRLQQYKTCSMRIPACYVATTRIQFLPIE